MPVVGKDTMQRTAKIFMNNRSQAVRIPKEFQFAVTEVYIRKQGDDLILSPRPKDWSGYLKDHPTASREFMEGVEELPFEDTDIASYIMGNKSRALMEKLQTVPTSAVCISAITKSELMFGVQISPRQQKDRAALEYLLRHMQVLDYPAEAASDYGQIRAALKMRGAPIGPNDTLIAAHARCLGLTLVTNNTRELERVPGLKMENWA
jgi:tRNA(fMet)-specific endonuclease VapC